MLLLTDDRGQFFSSKKEIGGSLDTVKIVNYFRKAGVDVETLGFSEVDFKKNFGDVFVLYQSTEDPDLRYKDFIEDVIYGLSLKGAVLIPGFKYFRAHHNKVFMEILREIFNFDKTFNFDTNFLEHLKSLKVIRMNFNFH